MRRYAVEFTGTFLLVLTIGCTGIAAAPGVIAPLAIGAVLIAMIYAGGHISGAHYNSAVTLGVFLRGRCPASDVLPYLGAQLLGAAGAAWIVGCALRGAGESILCPASWGVSGRVPFHVCAGVRRVVRGHGRRNRRELLGGAAAAFVFEALNQPAGPGPHSTGQQPGKSRGQHCSGEAHRNAPMDLWALRRPALSGAIIGRGATSRWRSLCPRHPGATG
jgi:hypothetical protein